MNALMAMLAAAQSGMKFDGEYRIPRGGGESRPSTLTRKKAKERRKKNRAAKKSRRNNRKH